MSGDPEAMSIAAPPDAPFPRIVRQLRRYLGVGALQALLSWGVFVLLTARGMPVIPGSVLGRVAGACLGYWCNGYYTFSLRHLAWSHAGRYLLVWSLLTLLCAGMVGLVAAQLGLHAAWLAKPIASALVACLGFFLWKYVVYRP